MQRPLRKDVTHVYTRYKDINLIHSLLNVYCILYITHVLRLYCIRENYQRARAQPFNMYFILRAYTAFIYVWVCKDITQVYRL